MSVPLAVLATLVEKVLPSGFHDSIHDLPLGLGISAGLVIADIGSYWGHRLSHEISFLWRFHAIHHSAEHIDFLVNGRAHPIDMVVTRMFELVPLYILGLGSAGPRGSMIPIAITLVGTIMGFLSPCQCALALWAARVAGGDAGGPSLASQPDRPYRS